MHGILRNTLLMKLPISPCAEKLELVLSTTPKTSDNTDKDSKITPTKTDHAVLSSMVCCLVTNKFLVFSCDSAVLSSMVCGLVTNKLLGTAKTLWTIG